MRLSNLRAGLSARWQGYICALATSAATFGVHLALDTPPEGQATLVLFTVPIVLSAYVGGGVADCSRQA